MTKNITIYDTTLRDGTQGEGVQVAVEDKLRLTRIFDEVGFDFHRSWLAWFQPSRC